MKTRILFVDDEPFVLNGLQRSLRGMRDTWEMAFASGGPQALEVLAERTFDVIVTDMRMPGMSGADLLQEVKARYPAVVRIVLSGHAERDLVTQCVGVAHQFISKPCDPDELKALIVNASAIGEEFMDQALRRIIGSVDRLPPVPRLYQELKRVLDEANVSSEQVAALIEQDMAMTAKVLQLVNSAFFGLRRNIETVSEAVNYLGMDTVRTLVLVNGIFENAAPLATRDFSIEDVWEHSLAVAHGAKLLAAAEGLDRPAQEQAFVGGVLHDLGILVLATNFPDAYGQVLHEVTCAKVAMDRAERAVFGVSHAEVGAYLVGLWALPAPILKVVGLHHQPSESMATAFTPLLAVHAADVICGEIVSHQVFGKAGFDMACLERLGLAGSIPRWRGLIGSAQPLNEGRPS
ncbi:response regulator [Mesoterricola sediminis]|uniref:Signal transduction protein n=1 Tax=Mesoterricola sediminis TaxID=2927980 RepID=A0AA48KEG3_9BACT|nr:response regulator [Mesoterricola sediminis]BDU75428.1 signal transduction protein [Mesoterricola sediminis]